MSKDPFAEPQPLVRQMFTVFDRKANTHGPPFLAENAEVAKRMLKLTANERGNQFNSHPEDYSLWLLGDFDLTHGVLDQYDRSEHVCNVEELVDRELQEIQHLDEARIKRLIDQRIDELVEALSMDAKLNEGSK